MTHFKRECNIVFYFHIGIEGIVLKHHRDISILWRHLVYDPPIHNDLTAADRFKPRNHTQQRCLPTSGWADKNNKFTLIYFHIHI